MGVDEEGTLARLKAYRRELIDPKIAEHRGRVVKTTGDGILIEFPSVVDAVRYAIDVQHGMAERNADVPEGARIEFRVGINLGDVIIDGDDIHGDGVNIAARLEALADPGGICISQTVLNHARDKVSFDGEDAGEQTLKNIARLVHVYRIIVDPSRRHATPQTRAPALALPDKPSIAVLAFQNMSGDPEQEYFADGISEEIITSLSKLRWFFVIARNSSFIYKGNAVDVKRIARELNVRYILEGSVRKGGNRVRITAQLIDATTGNHLWADRYDGELIDVFALQDGITNKVVAAIEPKLLEAEGIRSQSRSPEDLGAWDMVIRANALFWRMTKADGDAAVALLNRAVERYPDYAPAQSILAFMLAISDYYFGFSSIGFGAELERAANLGGRAAELDDGDPWAHLALGYVAFMMRRTDEAVGEFQRALDLNPNFAAAHGYLGLALAVDGRSDLAIAHAEQAIRMSPHDPQNSIFNVALAVANYLAGRFSEAIRFSRKALQQRPGLTAGRRIYVASLAQAGQMDEARAALARLKELHPAISIAWIEKHVPYTPLPMAKFLEGMRKAGLQ